MFCERVLKTAAHFFQSLFENWWYFFFFNLCLKTCHIFFFKTMDVNLRYTVKKKIAYMFQKFGIVSINGEPLETGNLDVREDFPVFGGYADVAIFRENKAILFIEIGASDRLYRRPGHWITVCPQQVMVEVWNNLYDDRMIVLESSVKNRTHSFRVHQISGNYALPDILDENFSSYIFLTKFNRDKNSIYTELFEEDYARPNENYFLTINRKRVILATVDAFIYHFFDESIPKHLAHDTHQNICQKLMDRPVPREITYGRGQIIFDHRLLIIIDRAQNLSADYYNFFCKLSRECFLHILAVGDSARALYFEQNFMTLHSTMVEHSTAHHFKRTGLRDLANAVGPGRIDTIHPRAKNKDCIIFEKHMEPRVVLDLISYWNCLPREVIIIMPFVENCERVEQLREALKLFWRGRGKRGRTRILSVFQADTLRAKCVILLGFHENNLKRISGGKIVNCQRNLPITRVDIPNCQLYSAITRAEKWLAVEIQYKDAVSEKFRGCVEYINFFTRMPRALYGHFESKFQNAGPRDFDLCAVRAATVSLIFTMRRFMEHERAGRLYEIVSAVAKTNLTLSVNYARHYTGPNVRMNCSGAELLFFKKKLELMQHYLRRMLMGDKVNFSGVLNAWMFSFCFSQLKDSAQRISADEFVWVYRELEKRGADETFPQRIKCVHLAYNAIEQKMRELGGKFSMDFNEVLERGRAEKLLFLELYFVSDTCVILCFVLSNYIEIAKLRSRLEKIMHLDVCDKFRGKRIINCFLNLGQNPIFFE